jgi:hypothetical protein
MCRCRPLQGPAFALLAAVRTGNLALVDQRLAVDPKLLHYKTLGDRCGRAAALLCMAGGTNCAHSFAHISRNGHVRLGKHCPACFCRETVFHIAASTPSGEAVLQHLDSYMREAASKQAAAGQQPAQEDHMKLLNAKVCHAVLKACMSSVPHMLGTPHSRWPHSCKAIHSTN